MQLLNETRNSSFTEFQVEDLYKNLSLTRFIGYSRIIMEILHLSFL